MSDFRFLPQIYTEKQDEESKLVFKKAFDLAAQKKFVKKLNQ